MALGQLLVGRGVVVGVDVVDEQRGEIVPITERVGHCGFDV
jgi:hypothetical protein